LIDINLAGKISKGNETKNENMFRFVHLFIICSFFSLIDELISIINFVMI